MLRRSAVRAAKGLCVLAAAGFLTLAGHGVVRSHCEIPCGIYGDVTRFDLLHEHIATVEKSMRQIRELSDDPSGNANQLIRWVGNKEEHAGKIQHIVTQYFMTQRVKPQGEDAAGRGDYVQQITTLHRILVHAMKAKQTTELEHCAELRGLVQRFAKSYLSEEDLEHVRDHHADG